MFESRVKIKLRNTPTCVGKTFNESYSASEGWKHPHVRGEDLSLP